MNIRQYLNIKDETFSITSNYLFIYGNKDNSTIINLQSKQKYINHNVMDPNMPLAKIFNIIIPNQTYEHILSLNNKVIYKEWFKKDFEPTELNFLTINDKGQSDRSREINVDTNLKPYGSSKPTYWNYPT